MCKPFASRPLHPKLSNPTIALVNPSISLEVEKKVDGDPSSRRVDGEAEPEPGKGKEITGATGVLRQKMVVAAGDLKIPRGNE